MKSKEKQLVVRHKKHLKACEKILKIRFRKRFFLLKALCHKSYGFRPNSDVYFCNERLEFLGDAVLGLIIAEYLFLKHTDKDEGVLTSIRSKLIRRETLADIARNISLGQFILLGENEARSNAHESNSILANAFEALIGAYFIDMGIKKTRVLVLRLFHELLKKEIHDLPVFEYKNKLQEYVQARFGKSPVYHIVSAEGPEHKKFFTSIVRVDEQLLGKGQGKSKKDAETFAAKNALHTLGEQI